ncbi:MAG: hypothetical protein ACOYJK_01815 [Prevotella sp.]
MIDLKLQHTALPKDTAAAVRRGISALSCTINHHSLPSEGLQSV